jgi:predicted patatin/cPLA2 family phospholipase
MVTIEMVAKNLQNLEDGLTLKTDYTDEKEELDQIENNAAVLRFFNAPAWKVADIKREAKRLRKWIKEEESSLI